MITACTGMLDMLRDFGLSMATVQRATISHAQLSMLFWIILRWGDFWRLSARPLPRFLWPSTMNHVFYGLVL